MTILYIFYSPGTFFRLWYHVPGKIWQHCSTWRSVNTKHEFGVVRMYDTNFDHDTKCGRTTTKFGLTTQIERFIFVSCDTKFGRTTQNLCRATQNLFGLPQNAVGQPQNLVGKHKLKGLYLCRATQIWSHDTEFLVARHKCVFRANTLTIQCPRRDWISRPISSSFAAKLPVHQKLVKTSNVLCFW
jgi:hypothetical protein